MGLNLPETRDTVFVASTPRRLLREIGLPTTYQQATDRDFQDFHVSDVNLNLISNAISLKNGDKQVVIHPENIKVPIEISPRKITTTLYTKSLVVIFG